jgi:hypothetical protein
LEKEEIINLIKKLMEEGNVLIKDIEELQKECKHKDGYEVRFEQGTNEVRRLCKNCGSVIGYPSEDDLKENGFK